MLYKQYYIPQTLDAAIALLGSAPPGTARPIAGGTDLMLQLHEGLVAVDTLVDVSRVPELCGVRRDGDTVRIGAATTYTELNASPVLSEHAALLIDAGHTVGAVQIQHMGTIGGNIGNASPAGDLLPCLYALDARLTLAGPAGQRTLPIAEFIQGVRQTALRPGELIVEIAFQGLPPPTASGSAFVKFGLRRSMAISVVNAAVVVYLRDGVVDHAAVALGAVAPTSVRSPAAEQVLAGQAPTPALFDRAGEAARADARPIDDIRGSAAFRRHLIKPLVREALAQACQRAGLPQEEITYA